MGKYLTKYSTGGDPAESTTGGVRMKVKKGGTVEEITGGGGTKRRKLEDKDVHVSSSSSSCLQLHSRTLVIRQPAGEKKKKKRKTEYSVETANCGEGVERNRVSSRCSSNSSGDFETTEERRSRSGYHNQESKEKGEDADFEFESCNLDHYHYDSEGGGEGRCVSENRRREWMPSSDQKENCSPEEEAEEEEEELDNLEAKGRGVEILSGRSTRPKTSGRNTSTLKSLSTKMPTETEIEGFFTAAENDQNKKFMEKYNYDLANDAPVEGRYEWIKLNP